MSGPTPTVTASTTPATVTTRLVRRPAVWVDVRHAFGDAERFVHDLAAALSPVVGVLALSEVGPADLR